MIIKVQQHINHKINQIILNQIILIKNLKGKKKRDADNKKSVGNKKGVDNKKDVDNKTEEDNKKNKDDKKRIDGNNNMQHNKLEGINNNKDNSDKTWEGSNKIKDNIVDSNKCKHSKDKENTKLHYQKEIIIDNFLWSIFDIS